MKRRTRFEAATPTRAAGIASIGLTLMLALGLVIPCLSCGDSGLFGPEAAFETHPGGTVVIGSIKDVESWNPYLCETAFAADVMALLYPSLVIEQPDYRDHPPSFSANIATHWGLSEDKRELTMHLRKNALWSDGVPVTSADVLYTWEVQRSPEVGWTGSYIKDFIDSVEALDETTVLYHFNKVYPYQVMDVNDGLILPAHVFSKIPFDHWRDTDWSQHVVCAGPFRLARHVPQQEIVLERNPDYFNPERPLLDSVIWRIVPSQSNLLTQLMTGSIDMMRTVPAADAKRVEASPDLRLAVYPDRRYTYIGWNNRHPILSDVRVRRALTLAIDREAILDSAAGGFGKIAIGPVLSRMWAFNDSLQPLPYDPALAVELLTEAGWTDHDGDGVLDRDGRPLRFELLTNNEAQERRDICLLIQQQLERIGIQVEPLFQDSGTVISRLYTGDFEAHVSSWQEPTQIDLEDVWMSPVEGVPSSNFVAYSNPEVDRLIEEAAGEAGFIEQQQLLEQVQELIVQDQPYTFLYESQARTGINRRIKGADINDASTYFNIDSWWVSGPPTGSR